MSSRRRSTVNVSRGLRREQDQANSAALELERLEQETTLVLQEIDHNLSRTNAVINDQMFPILERYAMSTDKVWENVAFWKHFMEEAADVELKTSKDTVESQKDVPKAVETKAPVRKQAANTEENANIVADETTSSLAQIEASTPQRPRSRSLLVVSRGENSLLTSRRRSAGSYGRFHSSLNRNTPLRRQSATEARRLSLILRHLNSSPTLPEPPILMSDIGRVNIETSSSAVRAPPRDRILSSSDSDSLNLGRFLPVLLQPLTLTPVGMKLSNTQERSAQRFPNTPLSSSALRRRSERHSLASPGLRGHDNIRQLLRDTADIPEPIPFTIAAQREDESDEIAVPQLLSLRKTSGKRDAHDQEASASKKRKVLDDDDDDNIFLDRSGSASKNISAVYHTMAHDPAHGAGGANEPQSKSMSEIFDRVLMAGPSELFLRGVSKSVDSLNETARKAVGAQGRERKESSASILEDETAKDPGENREEGARPDATENLSQGASSIDNALNSSDMDSCYREKWRSLTSTLRK